MQKYYSIRCPNCGKYSGKQCPEDRNIWEQPHTCAYCRKRFALKRKSEFALRTHISGPYEATEISHAVSQLNIPEKMRCKNE